MICKGSQRAGANQLAAHLLNDRDNEHVRVHELRGFAANDLHGAFQEAHAVSRATRCKQYLFSLSLNPPKDAITSEQDFTRAADVAEQRLGLTGQPRAIVVHEKEGRRHAHVVWSRIDADALKAINLPHFKRRLTELSRELYLEYNWPLPDGLRRFGGKSPLNFTLDEWQKAKRQGRDPREIKDAIRDCWARSDSAPAFVHALDERGFRLAQGDRRGFVVVDAEGKVWALARATGIKTREARDKLGAPDTLATVEAVKAELARTTTRQAMKFIHELRARQEFDLSQTRKPLFALAQTQRIDRRELSEAQNARQVAETLERAARFRRGLAGLWDTLTGRRRQLRLQNEAEHSAARLRDAKERDALMAEQFERRRPFQTDLDRTRKRQVEDRTLLARQLADHRRRLRQHTDPDPQPDQPRRRRQRGGPSLDL